MALIQKDIEHQKDSGEYGEKLPETYVVFITEKDVLGKGNAVYKIERYIDGEQLFNDGEHIIYVNGALDDNSTEIGKLMHDFRCSNPDDMNFKELANRARYFKQTEEGEQAMCKMMEDMRKEAAEKAVAETDVLRIRSVMKNLGVTAEQAMKAMDIPAKNFQKYMTML